MKVRPHLSISLAIILVLTGTVFFSLSDGAIKAPGPSGPPSRTIVQETESNNGWSSADLLPSTYGTFELHGNISNSNDYDHFYFYLVGGSGPVDEVTVTPTFFDNTYGDYIVGWFWASSPNNEFSHPPTYDLSMNLEMWDNMYYWNRLTIRASYTGNYGLIIRPAFGVTSEFLYNLTVTVSSVTPTDPRNDQPSSTDVPSGNVAYSEGLNTALDLFDWYHLTNPDPVHPLSLDLTTTITNPNPDTNDGSRDIGIEVDIIVYYNSRSDQTTFTSQRYRVSTRPLFQQFGCYPSPFDLKLEKNCTHMYVAYYIQYYILDTSNAKSYMAGFGSTTYSADFKVKASIPNNRPTLFDGGVTPSKGRSGDTFTFYVTYMDVNNETPRYIGVWLDGKPFRTLLPAPDSGPDNALGVKYQVQVPGSVIGKDKVHNFNFSAMDTRGDWAQLYPSGLNGLGGPIVDDNLPPKSKSGAVRIYGGLMEDREPLWIDLASLFSDDDLGDILSFTLLDQTGKWSSVLTDANLSARIIDNSTAPPSSWKLKVTFKENVNGRFRVRLNVSDNAFIPKYAELELLFDLSPVNDPPVIMRVNSVPVEEMVPIRKMQGDRIEVRVQSSDSDTNDVLTYEWDIGSVLKGAKKGSNYDWDPATGDLWFVTSDGDVPAMATTVRVSDGKGGVDEVKVEFTIDNVNDPPSLSVPNFRSTIEGEQVVIAPVFNDPDLRMGEEVLLFFYDAGPLSTISPPGAIEFSDSTGRLVIKAISERMNGEWDVNISVVDKAGLSAFGVCRIRIDNINDVPVPAEVNYLQQENNLTVTFYTDDVRDEDIGDVHTYIWTFGDGSSEMSGTGLKRVEHTFPAAGSYKVTLTVHDGTVRSKEMSVILQVQAPPPDPDQDDDEIDDWWELRFGLSSTDPTDAVEDLDRDGLTNLEEFDHYMMTGGMLNPRNPDTDGDGHRDGDELEYGSDPLDPEDMPRETEVDLGDVLWFLSIVMAVFSLLMMVVFAILKVRNSQKVVATPVLEPEQMAYYRQVGIQESYRSLPQPELQALPPAMPEVYGQQYAPDYPTSPVDQMGASYPPQIQTMAAGGPVELPVQADDRTYIKDGYAVETSPTDLLAQDPPAPGEAPPMQEVPLEGAEAAQPSEDPPPEGGSDLPSIPPPPDI